MELGTAHREQQQVAHLELSLVYTMYECKQDIHIAQAVCQREHPQPITDAQEYLRVGSSKLPGLSGVQSFELAYNESESVAE